MAHAVRPRFLTLLIALNLGGCASQPLVTLADEPRHYAWWLRTTFHPRGGELRGIPASSIDAGWCAVEELTPRHFEAFDGVHGRSVDEDAAGYAVRGPAVDGRPTRLVLVVYRVCGGETGTAMALLDGDARPRRVLAVEVITSPASYAMLDADTADRVRVVHCRECDDASEYRWDAQQRRFVPTTPTVDDPWARRP